MEFRLIFLLNHFIFIFNHAKNLSFEITHLIALNCKQKKIKISKAEWNQTKLKVWVKIYSTCHALISGVSILLLRVYFVITWNEGTKMKRRNEVKYQNIYKLWNNKKMNVNEKRKKAGKEVLKHLILHIKRLDTSTILKMKWNNLMNYY